MTIFGLTLHTNVRGVTLKSNLVDDNARLSKNDVGRVRIIPVRKITFSRGLDGLTILQQNTQEMC